MNWKWIITIEDDSYDSIGYYVFINDSEAMDFLYTHYGKFVIDIIKNKNWKDRDDD